MRLHFGIVLFASACIGHRVHHDPPAPAPVQATALQGTWTSPSCGTRPYARVLTFEASGALHGEERISPCPPDVKCMWSGIVRWDGTWKADKDLVALAVTGPLDPRATMPPPVTLHWEDDRVVEHAHGETCVYTATPQLTETTASR
jgi:hypothetical protein